MQNAVAYFRTSSLSNVGDDKDTLKRQKDAVETYAKKNKIQISSLKMIKIPTIPIDAPTKVFKEGFFLK